MKLYEMKIAPNPRRVRIFLAEKGIAVETVEVDLAKGEHMSEAFKAKNPMRKVPVLELDDGTCISETMAICRYFEELQPDPPLMGETPLEKAQIEMWQRQMEFYFMLPTGMCFQHTSGYFSAIRKTFPEWGERNREDVEKFFHYLNRHFAENTYVAGEKFTVADITALCALDFSKVNNVRIQPEQEHLARWYEAVNSRPSAKA
ncbi:glutathione S-transferase [Alkalilimnicola ehrlichii]|uniref:Glutathione S-transferase n=1 Tax=Alkalilimnicola ehrlichii TaxID=351052 RepID=A0A3E0X0W8_9GAMM|nr:glutathione S-transferase family protein [Alkalilimnicola ehrlichii]RFA30523.1 glutathione S-transferase [Alkalilimnicola ehrlichii]RFA38071.1 glutathione S-transferase [Alkalilimnicola ehrlichii]